MIDSGVKTKHSSKTKGVLKISSEKKKRKQECKTDNDIEYIKQVVKILKDNDLAEIKYETDHSEIKVVSNQRNIPQTALSPQTVTTPMQNQSATLATENVAPVATVVSSIGAIPPTVESPSGTVGHQGMNTSSVRTYENHPGAVKSPMVGTCYLSPEPNSPTFVRIGDAVKKDQPLLIIEAMKVMNYIKAPKDGKLIHIAVEDAQPVEFGQLLVVIE